MEAYIRIDSFKGYGDNLLFCTFCWETSTKRKKRIASLDERKFLREQICL